jgi:hemoglobin
MRSIRLLVVALAVGSFATISACKKDKKEEKKDDTADTENPCAGKTTDNPCAGKNPCGDENPCANPCGDDEKPLFDRLGGKDAITAVVDDFVANVVADDRINKYFAKADPAKLKEHLVNQICEASGGPCKYEGKDMKAAHAGMGITDEDFNALVEDLKKALDKHNVGAEEQEALLGALAPMKGDIVEEGGKSGVMGK